MGPPLSRQRHKKEHWERRLGLNCQVAFPPMLKYLETAVIPEACTLVSRHVSTPSFLTANI